MLRSSAMVLIAALILLSGAHAFALSPTLVEDVDMAWRSVRGGGEGNPVVSFEGDLTAGSVYRERFVDVPAWIVSEDFDGDGFYEAALQFAEGTLRIISLSSGRFRTVATARKMAPGVPPIAISSFAGEATGGLIGIDDRGDLVAVDHQTGRTRRLASGFSTLSHPVAAELDNDGNMEIAAVSDEGFMTVVKGRTQTRDDKSARLLPDTRLVVDDMDGDGLVEIVALSRPTDRVSSSRLGDDLAAQGIAVYNWDGRTLRLQSDFVLADDEVFETLGPFVLRTGDGEETVLMLPVTQKDKGSQVRSYTYNRGRLREKRKGPLVDIDQWIHILGSSRLGNSDRAYLVSALLPPEDDGDLVLYRTDLANTRITLGSSVSTHQFGSRLLESALIGDVDRDGNMELLAPGPGKSSLNIYTLDRNRLKRKEIFSSSGKILTNLCPGDFNGDRISDVMFGLDDGTLVVLFGK